MYGETPPGRSFSPRGCEAVKKGLCPFLTKGLQSAARTSCPLTADKTHTCSLSCIFCQVHAPTENDQNPFAACGRQTLRGFSDTVTPPGRSFSPRGCFYENRNLRQHRAIRQEVSDRIFAPIQSLENEGILYVFETVKKGLCPFLTKGLQSAARTSCPLTADKTHTCSLSCIFCQVHAPTENDQNLFAACGRQTLRGFFDTLNLAGLRPAKFPFTGVHGDHSQNLCQAYKNAPHTEPVRGAVHSYLGSVL